VNHPHHLSQPHMPLPHHQPQGRYWVEPRGAAGLERFFTISTYNRYMAKERTREYDVGKIHFKIMDVPEPEQDWATRLGEDWEYYGGHMGLRRGLMMRVLDTRRRCTSTSG